MPATLTRCLNASPAASGIGRDRGGRGASQSSCNRAETVRTISCLRALGGSFRSMGARLTSAIVVAALLACGGEVPQTDRDEQRARCSKQAGFDPAASDLERMLKTLKDEGLRKTFVP